MSQSTVFITNNMNQHSVVPVMKCSKWYSLDKDLRPLLQGRRSACL